MRKPIYALCEQQRRRSACASAQSDQHLCCSLFRQYNTSTCYSRNFKTLASLCSRAGRFESYLVANPEDKFSRDMDHGQNCASKVRVHVALFKGSNYSSQCDRLVRSNRKESSRSQLRLVRCKPAD